MQAYSHAEVYSQKMNVLTLILAACAQLCSHMEWLDILMTSSYQLPALSDNLRPTDIINKINLISLINQLDKILEISWMLCSLWKDSGPGCLCLLAHIKAVAKPKTNFNSVTDGYKAGIYEENIMLKFCSSMTVLALSFTWS